MFQLFSGVHEARDMGDREQMTSRRFADRLRTDG
jgi:hypothetical protein